MISIIIPTLNEEAVIGRTLRSLRDGLKNIPHELILSDGGSRDRTAVIAQECGARVVTEVSPRRQTIGRGRNLGAQVAQGEILLFLDADMTIPDPEHFFHELLALFERDQQLVGLTVPLRVLPELQTFGDRCFFGYANLMRRFLNNVLHSGTAPGEFQMIRSSAFVRIGGYREDLAAGEDNDLFARLAKIGKTLFYAPLTVYHTGRRGHIEGWGKLLLSWTLNLIWVALFNRSYSKEWKEVR